MPPTVVSRRARAWALAGLSSCIVSCYENESGGGNVAALFDVVERVSMKACACDAQDPDDPSEDDDCGQSIERLDCLEPIVQKHAAQVADWASCSLQAYREIEACFDRLSCDQDRIETCFEDIDLDERCGEPPAEVDDAIADESGKQCLRNIECSDGSVVRGNDCNDIAECPDGSDEEFCPSDVDFTCVSGERVSVSYLCDGLDDCEDGSDEAAAQCASGSSP